MIPTVAFLVLRYYQCHISAQETKRFKNREPKLEVHGSLFTETGPITVNIVLLARNNRTILIQHPILSHFQAIKRFKPDQIFKIFGFPGISPGFSYFSTVGIFSVPFRNDPIVLI